MAKHKLIVTREEMENIVRGYFDVRPDTIVEIEEVINQPAVSQPAWIIMPDDWMDCCPPPQALQYEQIMVMFSDGGVESGSPDDWSLSWSQAGNQNWNIIKFQPLMIK